MEKTRQEQYDLSSILIFLWRYRLVLLIATFLGCGLAYVRTKMIPPKYESFAILYPSPTSSRDKLLEDFEFGYDIHAERLIQLLESDAIRDSILETFNLIEHYNLDTTRQGWYDQFLRKLYENIAITKTRYKSVSIKVRDTDPVLAARIANEICRLVNVVAAEIRRQGAGEALKTLQKRFQGRENLMGLMADSLGSMENNLVRGREVRIKDRINAQEVKITRLRKRLDDLRRKHNIFDYGFQVNILNEQLAVAQAAFLQESGKLSVLGSGASTEEGDTAVVNTSARKEGARKRVEYFRGQLNALAGINETYTRTVDELDQATTLLASMQGELEKLAETRKLDEKETNQALIERDLYMDQEVVRELKTRYEKALQNMIDPAPAAYVISSARPSFKKASPSTLFNVAITGVLVIFFTIIVLAFRERLQDVRKRLREQA